MRISDAWLTLGFVVAAASVTLFAPAGPPYHALDAVGVGLAVGSALCLLWRRVAPIAVVFATSAFVVINAAAGYATTVTQWPAWISLFTLFSLRGATARIIGSTLELAAVAGYVLLDRAPVGGADVFGVTVCFLLATVTGDAARSRRAVSIAEHARVRAEERTELARELHDAIGHAVNVMVMQAGVGRRVFADDPSFVREALGNIESVGREALGELDRLVRVLHAAEPVTDLTGLVERVRAAGRELRLNAEEVEVSEGVARALHRIVQEALTNALRHTETGRIEVDLVRSGGTVVLEIVNQGRHLPVGPPGRGLANMRERARLVGGEVEAGPIQAGFRVRATLPAEALS
ncbi:MULTISPECIES: histidine kinase [unclassified Embleya]|uniref:sensor histidine kinase n=1 Tax=unclassified Embleya TaxID=2699296 RepID=UPI0033FC9BFA